MSAGDSLESGGRALVRATRWLARLVRGEVVKRVGGPARARVITIFGAVLALNGAESATVGAVAPQLERALHIGNTKIGLLASVSLLVGALFTIPVGLLVDRVKRVPILLISIVLWSVASLVSAFSANYSSLLLTRLLLGAVTATAGPAIASLTGDYFPGGARADLRVHPRRRDRRHGGGLHHQRQRREPDHVAGRVPAARDSGLLPRTRAVPNGARASPRRPEPARAGRRHRPCRHHRRRVSVPGATAG